MRRFRIAIKKIVTEVVELDAINEEAALLLLLENKSKEGENVFISIDAITSNIPNQPIEKSYA